MIFIESNKFWKIMKRACGLSLKGMILRQICRKHVTVIACRKQEHRLIAS